MGKARFLPMEFSIVVMITVASLLAHGDSPPGKTGEKIYSSVPDRDSLGRIKESTERLSSSSVGRSEDKPMFDDSEDQNIRPSILNSKDLSVIPTIPEHFVNDFHSEEGNTEFEVKGLTEEKRKNDKKQYSRKFKYDPALALMGLGKRLSQFDPALKYMGLGKRKSQYDPALKYMGLGKRKAQYDPALKFMGLGKRGAQYDPALKYMGLGKRGAQYDPALKYMGLGKRGAQYDPALKYMGLGKRGAQYDPALKYMGLGKRAAQYDPALKYMGLGKRGAQYDPALKYMGLGKRAAQYDPALKYMGLGKRGSQYDPALKYMGLGKRGGQYDPALKYMGLGKRAAQYDPALKYMGLGKRANQYDPALKYMGLGKREPNYDPALMYMGLGKRKSQYDPALRYMGLGKRLNAYDPGLKYMGLGKRSSAFDPGLKYMGLGKRTDMYDPSMENDFDDNLTHESNPSNDYSDKYVFSDHDLLPYDEIYDPEDNEENVRNEFKEKNNLRNFIDNNPEYIPDLEKRPYKIDPALHYMGLGKRWDLALQEKYPEMDKRPSNFDPALKYMGLGKREPSSSQSDTSQDKNTLLQIFGDNDTKYAPAYDLSDPRILLRSTSENSDRKFDHKAVNNKSSTNNSNNKVPKIISAEQGNGRKGDLNTHSEGRENSFPSKAMYDKGVMYMALDKRGNKYDPALLYMGLGKRGRVYDPKMYYTFGKDEGRTYETDHKYVGLGKPEIAYGSGETVDVNILEFAKHSNDTKDCKDGCLKRRKRHIRSRFGEYTADFDEKNSLDDEISGIENGEEKEKENYDIQEIKKRERDNRPRYNPGWIFIGLGKRDDGKNVISSIDEMNNKYENKIRYNDLFEDYYGLLDKIKDKLQNISSEQTLGYKTGRYSNSLKKLKHKVSPQKQQNEVRNDDYTWSMPTTPRVVISDGIPPDSWLDFVPTITKIGN